MEIFFWQCLDRGITSDLNPKISENLLAILSREGTESWVCDIRKNRSSAKISLCSWCPSLTHLIAVWVLIATINSSGEKGQPCFVPLLI